jgi:hypothetical protein
VTGTLPCACPTIMFNVAIDPVSCPVLNKSNIKFTH